MKNGLLECSFPHFTGMEQSLSISLKKKNDLARNQIISFLFILYKYVILIRNRYLITISCIEKKSRKSSGKVIEIKLWVLLITTRKPLVHPLALAETLVI